MVTIRVDVDLPTFSSTENTVFVFVCSGATADGESDVRRRSAIAQDLVSNRRPSVFHSFRLLTHTVCLHGNASLSSIDRSTNERTNTVSTPCTTLLNENPDAPRPTAIRAVSASQIIACLPPFRMSNRLCLVLRICLSAPLRCSRRRHVYFDVEHCFCASVNVRVANKRSTRDSVAAQFRLVRLACVTNRARDFLRFFFFSIYCLCFDSRPGNRISFAEVIILRCIACCIHVRSQSWCQ